MKKFYWKAERIKNGTWTVYGYSRVDSTGRWIETEGFKTEEAANSFAKEMTEGCLVEMPSV